MNPIPYSWVLYSSIQNFHHGVGGGMDWESEISRCKLSHIDYNKVLLCFTGNVLYPVINRNRKECMYVCICVCECV